MVEPEAASATCKSPNKSADEIKSPLYIRQLTEERGWPIHVEKLAKENLELPVTIQHISAALAFIMCVESGFVPESKIDALPDAETIYKSLDCDKIPGFSSMYPDSSRVPDCLSIMFRAIVGVTTFNTQIEGNNIVNSSSEQKTIISTQSETAPSTSKAITPNERPNTEGEIKECRVPEDSLIYGNPKSRFTYSSPIKLVMLMLEDCIQINGLHQGCDLRNYRVSYKFNLHKYFKKPLQTENAGVVIKKLAKEWMSDLRLILDAPRMAQDFKTEFSLHLMDSVGGFSNELRGIQSLPAEVLIKILTLCSAQTVVHIGQTSRYLRFVTDDQFLWRQLVWRDYRNSRRANDEAVLAAGKKPPDYSHDYKTVYKQLWLSSQQRVLLTRQPDWDGYYSDDDYDDYFGRDGYFGYSDDDDMGLFGFI